MPSCSRGPRSTARRSSRWTTRSCRRGIGASSARCWRSGCSPLPVVAHRAPDVGEIVHTRSITVTVNGVEYTREVEHRMTLADFLRHEIDLTGTHLGCEHGVCGACTVLVDGLSMRGCLTLAVQASGRSVTTVEGLAG